MLTIFTIPKAFYGLSEIIQTNAIKSWLFLSPQPEIILLGKDEGTADIASQLGSKHITDIECNQYGTPLVSSMFEIAQNAASYSLMCYINADIILMSDFMSAIRQIHMPSFLVIGQRWDVELNALVDFNNADWEADLRSLVEEKGKLHARSGIDYFVFNRGLYREIPSFAVGRTAWDNWLVYQARRLKAPLIDATASITAIHQNHDYSHNKDGHAGIWKGPEAELNLELAGGIRYAFTIEHATWKLTRRGVKRALTARNLFFRLMAVAVLSPKMHFLFVPLRILSRLLINLRKRLGVTPKN
ncbi:MAG: hypothetical protein JSV32_03485 [Dehalococcoidia bacterium]|nr:MAG: hypothetical protein JSV32_03485 [Dehalococcoidia bacterium]